MTDKHKADRDRLSAERRRRVYGRAACLAAFLAVATAGSSAAQQAPLPPPDTPPPSRLTITPSEFEQWLGRHPAGVDAATAPDTPRPRLVPPPPPVLATPPPAISLPLPVTPPAPPPALTMPAKPPAIATVPPESPAISPSTAAPPATETPPDPVRILYAADATDLPAAALPALDTIAAWVGDNPDARIELLGYASESSQVGSEARRRALLRVLAVRNYLVGKGVLSTRMDVRALGDQTAGEPRDRVEVRVPPS